MTTPSLRMRTPQLLLRLLLLLSPTLLPLSSSSSSSSSSSLWPSLVVAAADTPSARDQGDNVWNLLGEHYGYENGGYLAYSLQLLKLQDREDLLRQLVERMRRNGRLSQLCRYVTQVSCSRPVQSQNSMFLYIVQTMTAQCCSTGPVNGNWGQWGSWSSCSVTCGYGTRSSTRACNSPAPSGGGQTCAGYPVKHQQCFAATCGAVNGAWGQWGSWSACSVTCGQGSRSRSRQCNSPAPSGGGQQCPGNGVDQAQCFPTPCPSGPVNGNWGQWGSWSSCSVTCGYGLKSSSRACNSPAPSGGGQTCVGGGVKYQSCFTATCGLVHGAWGLWGSWSTCSVTCGQGSRSRSRQCDSPAPSGGGQQCPGSSVDQAQCFPTLCPNDATWGTWGQWSACSVSCGQGTRTRSRRCLTVTPGQQCLGESVDWDPCQQPSCTGQRTCSVTQYPPSVRIFGGSAARPGQYPWLVHLVIDGTIRCAGVIVDALHVLTAAHCLGRNVQNGFITTENMEIIAGNYKRNVTLEPNAQRIPVAKALRHHEYDPIYLTNDVAVLKLARPLTFNNVVSNICLPSKTDTLPTSCVVAGWGALSFSDDFPEQLQHVQLLVYDRQACVDTFNATTNYDIGQFLMEGVMCAANGTSGGMDSCRGDSGSGLMCLDRDSQGPYYKLFGLVSSGFGCGLRGQPGYYAYLPYYADWMKKAITFLSN